jgi:HAD superfamily hydrolase (TIGR01549 family)
VLEFLKSKNTRLLICSDADAEVLNHELTKFKITDYFEHVFISNNLKAYKPNDKVISTLNNFLTGNREEALFVGDSRQDIITGQKLGIKTAYINRLA